LKYIRWTKLIKLGRYLSLPFQNFIYPTDLARMKYNSKEAPVASWKMILLLLMSTLEGLVYLFHTTYAYVTRGKSSIALTVGLLSWVSGRLPYI